jgi:hypothetical protein
MKTVYTVEPMVREYEPNTGHSIVARRIDTATNVEVSNKVVARYHAEIPRAEVDRQAAEMQAGYDRVREYATTSLEVVDER